RRRWKFLALGERRHAHRRLGENSHAPLGAEDRFLEVGTRGRGGKERQLQRPRGRDEGAAREELLDAPEAERLLSARARRDPPAERRELEGLREVPEREA